MHEMSLAQEILEIVESHLPASNDAPVQSVRVRIGEYAGIVPESLEFCFGVLSEATRARGAALVIDRVPAMARCNKCSSSSAIEITSFECPSCGSNELTLVSGNELQVVEIELGDTGSREGSPS